VQIMHRPSSANGNIWPTLRRAGPS